MAERPNKKGPRCVVWLARLQFRSALRVPVRNFMGVVPRVTTNTRTFIHALTAPYDHRFDTSSEKTSVFKHCSTQCTLILAIAWGGRAGSRTVPCVLRACGLEERAVCRTTMLPEVFRGLPQLLQE